MRYDKAGNYDGAYGYSRQCFRHPGCQAEYDAHYDHSVAMLAQGAEPRQLTYADPDLNRTIEDYLSIGKPLLRHRDGT